MKPDELFELSREARYWREPFQPFQILSSESSPRQRGKRAGYVRRSPRTVRGLGTQAFLPRTWERRDFKAGASGW